MCCAQATAHRMPNKLVLPEGLKLVALYALAVMKCKAMRGAAKDVALDDRSAIAYHMMAMSLPATLRFLYPTLYPLHTLPEDCCGPRPDGAPFSHPPHRI